MPFQVLSAFVEVCTATPKTVSQQAREVLARCPVQCFTWIRNRINSKMVGIAVLVHASARLLFLPSLNDFHHLERRLYITGHSLGGGLAKLVAANVSIQAGRVIHHAFLE